MRFSSLLVLGLASQVQADKIPVTQLTDATFELLTQAATGATTGDWLVHFTPNKCEDCPAVMNMLDELAPKYGRGMPRVQLANLDCAETGEETCKRFGITDKPVMMFLHHGLLYVYTGSRALKGIDAFAKGGWREMSGVKVPEEQGWLLTQMDSIGQMFSQVVRGFEANHNPEDYK
eukprot:Ihof_evm5s259 gene=Ihof_evmTU5s259